MVGAWEIWFRNPYICSLRRAHGTCGAGIRLGTRPRSDDREITCVGRVDGEECIDAAGGPGCAHRIADTMLISTHNFSLRAVVYVDCGSFTSPIAREIMLATSLSVRCPPPPSTITALARAQSTPSCSLGAPQLASSPPDNSFLACVYVRL